MDWSSCWCWLALLALGIFCMIFGLVQSRKQPSTTAALMCIRRVALLEKVTSFGAAYLKNIPVCYHLLHQHLGLLGRFEFPIRPASAIVCTHVPGQHYSYLLLFLTIVPYPPAAVITDNITAGGAHALLRSGGIGSSVCIHHCGGGQRRAAAGGDGTQRRRRAAAAKYISRTTNRAEEGRHEGVVSAT